MTKLYKVFGILVLAGLLMAIPIFNAAAQSQESSTSHASQPPHGEHPLSEEALAAAAEALGMTAEELSTALEAGSTLEELATAAGVDAQVVKDAVRAVMPERAGRGEIRWTEEALTAAAEALGMTADELSTALEAGSTLEELATAAGVDAQVVKDAVRNVMPQGGKSGERPDGHRP